MNKHTILGTGAAILAAGAVAAPLASAATATPVARVTIEVVGLHNRTLLKSTKVTVPTGKLTFDGHKYAANTVLGVLETATKGKVVGTWSSYGAFVYSIEGENLGKSGKSAYFETLINHKAASLGDSSQTVKANETIVIKAVNG